MIKKVEGEMNGTKDVSKKHFIDSSILSKYLEKNIPLDYKWGAHMWFITHGKYVCKARPPQCAKCFLQNYCKHYNDKIRINNR